MKIARVRNGMLDMWQADPSPKPNDNAHDKTPQSVITKVWKNEAKPSTSDAT